MYDFKTFAQMNLDLLFKGFQRMPSPGEEVFADTFLLQLGGGPQVCSLVLDKLGCQVQLGTFLGDDDLSNISRTLLKKYGFRNVTNFPVDHPEPVVVTCVFSFDSDRAFLSHNTHVYESLLAGQVVYDFLSDAKVTFAPVGHPDVTKRLHDAGVRIVYDRGWSDDLSIDDMKDFLPFVDVFAPNDKEAMKISGTGNPEDALRFLARYTKHPVITLGKGGCAYFDDGAVQYLPAIDDFHAVDTTGAGDNFMAGVIYGMARGDSIRECLSLGNLFAGQSTTAIGCYGAEITHELIEKYR
ncbi:MAG: carbohydrate kinase family protein [Christensenella sp.]|nr:carbohydrate kinase family protein [Christensenella sp.]